MPTMTNRRLSDLGTFYSHLLKLQDGLGGHRALATCTGLLSWPPRGVYFFMEPGENRSDTGTGLRIVRVGTHALTDGAGTKLWTRLSQHRGQATTGGGNHRGSIFRLLVGTALIGKNHYDCPTWDHGNHAPPDVRAAEQDLEREVSAVIGRMPFLWLAIDDAPSAQSLRGYLERNSIALLSNFDKDRLDPPSADWLGHYCSRERVRKSGLWNSNHVHEAYDENFLAVLAQLIDEMVTQHDRGHTMRQP